MKNFITCFKGEVTPFWCEILRDSFNIYFFYDLYIDKKFLAFFFRRIKRNSTGRYEGDFPYVSPCGPETNYIRCDDLPVVFTHLLDDKGQPIQDIESYGNSLLQPPQSGGESSSGQDSNFNPLRTQNSIPNSSIHQHNSTSDPSNQYRSPDLSTNPTHDGSGTISSQTCTEVLSYGGAGDSLCVLFQPQKLCMLPEGGRVYHAGPDKLEGVGLVKSSLAIELSRFFVYEEGACSESSSPVGFRWRGRTWTIDGSTVNRLRELRMRINNNRD